ncbi:efflux RND transporter periplasmic adaptor subunit [Thiomicrorhabdus indica]|uniref:efflux RND transporter periplasmic adaptor subunit n=1 Tax=Thiomicrorhabdus indica TaxID=2267253 RepID=UPI00102E0E8A|nr:efflux RND transporter periplasmic adaptor subunit [Thiomicrorhabdus indica]
MKHSFAISIGLLLLLIVWMLLGDSPKPEQENTLKGSNGLVSVEVRDSKAQWVTSSIKAYGDLLPLRETKVLAQTYGKVESLHTLEGDAVDQGQLLLTLSIEDREAKLKRAEAKTLEAKNRYQATRKLQNKGFSAQQQIDELFAAFEAAKAEEAILRQEVDQLRVYAPFKGVIAKQLVELGDYIFKGNPLFELIDTQSMIAEVAVAQSDFPFLKIGHAVQVSLATGEKLSGKIRFIAPKADENTKTFKVEILLENTAHLPSGISVTAIIPKARERAHLISSALLSLNEQGIVGVKIVNAQEKVAFYPVKLVHAEKNGIFVTGLPEQVHLIVTGQGFVLAGQKVHAVFTEETRNPNDVMQPLEVRD